MADYSLHTRFVFTNYDDIQNAINAGTINYRDIVFCTDTREMVLVNSQHGFTPINSRHYRFNSYAEAVRLLNTYADTYEGQIVSVRNVSTGKFEAYIVNYVDDKWTISNLAIADSVEFNYNLALNKPIDNLVGSVFEPVVLTDLGNGIYKITGAFKVSSDVLTVQSTAGGQFVMVDTIDGVKYIRCISAKEIIEYHVDSQGNITSDSVPTKTWIEQQGFATTNYVDEQLAALNFFTKSEAEEYIISVVSEVNEDAINAVIDQRLIEATRQEINDLFNIDGDDMYLFPAYTGVVNVVPAAFEDQVLPTATKALLDDITVEEIPYTETESQSGGITVRIGS